MSGKGTKKDSLLDAISGLSKKYGNGAIAALSDPVYETPEIVIPTGSLSLDVALGVGGWPAGRVVQILGNPSAGKTTMCIHAVAEAQKMGLNCVYIDTEHAIDLDYAQAIGLNPETCYLAQPDSGEEAFDIADTLINTGAIHVVVIDSIANIATRAMLNAEMGDMMVGGAARLISNFLLRVVGPIRRNNVLLLIVNQYRDSIGTMGYGPQKKTAGGWAPKYQSSVIVDIARTGSTKDGGEDTGNKIKATVKKNRVARPFTTAEYEIDFGLGISQVGEVIDYGVEYGVLSRSGAWYKDAGGTSLAQGKEKMKQYLRENNEYYEQIKALVREQLSIRGTGSNEYPIDQE